jgi:DNA-binding HxlR family transcriptional regulator
VSRELGGKGLVGGVRGRVEIGTRYADLGDVRAQYGDGVLGSSLLDLVRLRVATSAERDLAVRAGVEHPVGCANTIPLKIGQFAQAAEFIHPKWLTIRLRQLEHEGIVTREQLPGRREVWYELTEKGRDLAPVLEALVAWGLKYERHPLDQARLHTPST